MFVVRDTFRCKPGKAKDLADRFKRVLPLMARDDGFVNGRVMVDAVSEYWTVVLETDCASLAQFEQHMAEFSQRPDVREVMAGYMDLVDGGRRDIYRVV